jgi:hypothetical protein
MGSYGSGGVNVHRPTATDAAAAGPGGSITRVGVVTPTPPDAAA